MHRALKQIWRENWGRKHFLVAKEWVTENARILISHVLLGLWKKSKTEMEREYKERVKKKRQADEREQSSSNLYADETRKPDLQTFYID